MRLLDAYALERRERMAGGRFATRVPQDLEDVGAFVDGQRACIDEGELTRLRAMVDALHIEPARVWTLDGLLLMVDLATALLELACNVPGEDPQISVVAGEVGVGRKRHQHHTHLRRIRPAEGYRSRRGPRRWCDVSPAGTPLDDQRLAGGQREALI